MAVKYLPLTETSPVVKIDGECYFYVEDSNRPPDSVADETFADCASCQAPSPPVIDPTKYYCVRIDYSFFSDCSAPFDSFVDCMLGSDINIYGGWDNCYFNGAIYLLHTYNSGPYDASNCDGVCGS
jgi:hypothetical protein